MKYFISPAMVSLLAYVKEGDNVLLVEKAAAVVICLFNMAANHIGGQLLFVQIGDLKHQAEIGVLLFPVQAGELTAHLNIVRRPV